MVTLKAAEHGGVDVQAIQDLKIAITLHSSSGD